MDISNRILEIRDSKRLTQTDVAHSLGMEQSNYSRMEKRGDKMTIEQAKRIADALGVSLIDLLGDTVIDSRQERIRELELEIQELKKKIDLAGHIGILANLLTANPERLAYFAEIVSTGKVSKGDIEVIFPDVKAQFEQPVKERK